MGAIQGALGSMIQSIAGMSAIGRGIKEVGKQTKATEAQTEAIKKLNPEEEATRQLGERVEGAKERFTTEAADYAAQKYLEEHPEATEEDFMSSDEGQKRYDVINKALEHAQAAGTHPMEELYKLDNPQELYQKIHRSKIKASKR